VSRHGTTGRVPGWRSLVAALVATAALVTTAPATAATADAPKLTAAEIIAKNATARGGAEAWQKLTTLVYAGHVEMSSTPGRKLPFQLELKRPGRTRFEINSETGKSVRIYDGTQGWKLRRNAAGQPEVVPYTADDLVFARGGQIIDGPLMDYAAKAGAIAAAGVAPLEGRSAYVLNAKLPNGDTGRVWVDTETFLELRADRVVHNAAGQTVTATVYYRDYRTFQGIKIPVIIETAAAADKPGDKLVIEKVAVNPPIDDKTFARPPIATPRHGGIIVDARSAAAPPAPPAPAPQASQ
jgi:outer membrane lipoprotein-sorting protein